MGIGAGVYQHNNIWANESRFSLAMNRKWGNDKRFLNAALMFNRTTRKFKPLHDRYSFLFPQRNYSTVSLGLNAVINHWNFDAVSDVNLGSMGAERTRIYTQIAYQFNIGSWYVEPSIRNYTVGRLLGHDANLLVRHGSFIAGAGFTVSASGTYIKPMAGFQKERWSLFYGLNRHQGGYQAALTDPFRINHELSLQINPFGSKNRSTSWIM